MTIGSYAFYLVRGLPPLPKLGRPVRIGFLDSSVPRFLLVQALIRQDISGSVFSILLVFR